VPRVYKDQLDGKGRKGEGKNISGYSIKIPVLCYRILDAYLSPFLSPRGRG
jgi:hypothetical protein